MPPESYSRLNGSAPAAEIKKSLGERNGSQSIVARRVSLENVAMGLAAMAGYIAKSVQGSGAALTQNPAVHAAPGTVLRQDKGTSGSLLDRGAEAGAPAAVLPSWAYRETTPNGNPRILVDDPAFVNQYKQQPASVQSTGHRELP